ncbi:MAG: hypothetical protein MUC49_19160 [Raineya sp.]|nr:hypothetical protein [Raineya sp.]
MKKYILTFVIALLSLYSQAQQMPLPDPNSANTLFIKHKQDTISTVLVSDKNEAQIRAANGTDWTWTDCYMFFSHDTQGRSIDFQFYTPNKEYFAYTVLSTYNSVIITYTQLRDILATKTSAGKYDYLKGFSHIYIIDLDSPQPKQPTKYMSGNIIKLKPLK